jgi:aspartyl-tRNA(Asn)/glutamyl-tRNA(Gln) amidotransferase subunit B
MVVKYEIVIGMEVHVQLQTKSKMFCACDANIFGESPNSHVCPVCMGMPGVLPVINRQAVEFAIMTGLALNCQVAEYSVFARKNYNYPDLPKGYQISQYELPLCYDGWIEVEVDGQSRRIGITRAHLEEDTGKLFHVGGDSLVDYNRSGIPLLEIVTEPEIRSAEEARQYLTKLRTILRYLDVSSGDMEKGAMRCEANVSLRPVGSDEFGTKVEVKNLNSIRAVKQALAYEIQRQANVLDAGGIVEHVTMGWDERRGVTVVQRSKEYADDYRYFPEPDLPPLEVSREWVEEIRTRLPELPDVKRDRFVRDYGLSRYDAGVLAADRSVAAYFEACVAAYPQAKTVANWIIGDLFRWMRESGTDIGAVRIAPQGLAELLALVEEKTINVSTARDVFGVMFDTGGSAGEIVAGRGLAQVSDSEALAEIVAQVLADNPDAVQQYLDGKETVAKFLMGQVMRVTRGRADPQVVRRLLQEQLQAMR